MTTPNYPKTSHLELSKSRIARFVAEARDAFNRNDIARLILTRILDESDHDYRKIGFNNIVDRIWFVDGVFEGTSYATPSGMPYGMTVAEAETKLVLDKFISYAHDHATNLVIETSDPSEDQIVELVQRMLQDGFNPSVIVASVQLSSRFWDFRSFNGVQEVRRGLLSPEGHLQNIPVHHCRLLQDGVILIVDRTALGTLKVKKDFNVSVLDIIEKDERERIKRDVPSLSNADFNEKVRILGFEVVKATIQNSACALIKTSGTPLELKKFT